MKLIRVVSLRWLEIVMLGAGFTTALATVRGFVVGGSEIALFTGLLTASLFTSAGVLAATVERLATEIAALRSSSEE